MGKLHDRMKEDLLLKAYSPHTQSAYRRCARHFASHCMRSPQEMGEQKIRGFLLHLVRDRKASPATLDMCVNALKFLYNITLKRPELVKDLSHPKRPKTLPVILSPAEVLRIFAAIRSLKYKAIIAAAYAAGLRISEVCGLRIADIDSQRMRIHSRSGKGQKDRSVMLGESPLALLRQYYQAARPQGEYLFPGPEPQRHITPPPCVRFCGRSSGRRLCRRRSPCTPCATALPPWRPAPTSASCRFSWATAQSAGPVQSRIRLQSSVCGRPPKPSGNLPRTTSAWGLRSVLPPYCTPGIRSSIPITICTS